MGGTKSMAARREKVAERQTMDRDAAIAEMLGAWLQVYGWESSYRVEDDPRARIVCTYERRGVACVVYRERGVGMVDHAAAVLGALRTASVTI